jgi:hypothetical protein
MKHCIHPAIPLRMRGPTVTMVTAAPPSSSLSGSSSATSWSWSGLTWHSSHEASCSRFTRDDRRRKRVPSGHEALASLQAISGTWKKRYCYHALLLSLPCRRYQAQPRPSITDSRIQTRTFVFPAWRSSTAHTSGNIRHAEPVYLKKIQDNFLS